MFKKSRRKIIGAILLVLVLVLSGTFCVIYLASYVDMTNENRKLLEQYVNTYSLPGPGRLTLRPGRMEPAAPDGKISKVLPGTRKALTEVQIRAAGGAAAGGIRRFWNFPHFILL